MTLSAVWQVIRLFNHESSVLFRVRAAVVSGVARPAAVATVVVLLIYLVLAPGVTADLDAGYHRRLEYLTDTEGAWNRIESQIAAVKADPDLMEELRNKVQERRRRLEESRP